MSLPDLSPSDAADFGRVVYEFQSARPDSPLRQREYENLQSLVALHGAEAVLKAIHNLASSGATPSQVGQISAYLELDDPLLRQIMALHEQEIAPHQPVSGRLRGLLLAMKEEFPDFDMWQEAVTRAVKANHRTLEYVDKLMRRRQTTGSWDPPTRAKKTDHARTKEPKRRTPSRETKYDPAALQAEREGDDTAGWERPADLL